MTGNNTPNKRRLFGKRFRMGSYSAFATVIVIAIAVIINMIAGSLPVTTTQIDMTIQSLYSISDQTRRIVSSLDKDVQMYLIATTGTEDSTITRMLDQYAAMNDHIKVTYIDPSVYPNFLKNYEFKSSQLYTNSVLVECGEKYRLVSNKDIYVTTYDTSNYETTGQYTTYTEYNGEAVITTAIHYVTSDSLPVLYELKGHGETSMSSTIKEELLKDNIAVETLNLLASEAMPEDISALLINGPTSDITDTEAELLIEWLNNGGRIMMLTDYLEPEEVPNLMRVAAVMGLTLEQGMVLEANSNMYYSYPHYLMPDMSTHTIVAELRDSYYIMTPLAQPIAKLEGTTASVAWLLTTSNKAYLKLDAKNSTIQQNDEDPVGTYHVGAVSLLDDSKLCWVTSAMLLDEGIDYVVAGANSNMFLNAINWLCEQEESISIRGKLLGTTVLTLTEGQSNMWSIILLAVIPMSFICLGVVISIRRKRR